MTRKPAIDADRPDDTAAGPSGSNSGRAGASLVLNLLLALGSLFVVFLFLEFGLRIYHGRPFDFSSQLPPPPNRAETPAALYDDVLGWVPKPGMHEREGSDETWSVDDAGLRNNGDFTPSTGRPPIVAVGDSFTFGDEVFDPETWPARLEALLDTRVVNGGVFAYGVDQAYLRALELIETYQPSTVLLAFISDDLSRAELSFYAAWKPYFQFDGDTLALRNVPVPTGRAPLPRFGRLRDVVSRSYVLSALLRRVARSWWMYGQTERAHDDGDAVAIELFSRLDSLARSHGSRFAVIALGTNGRIGGNRRIGNVVMGARNRGVRVLDLVPEIEQIPADSVQVLFRARGHYSPPMNARVAARIATFLADSL
jgi:hypothetical protein